MVRTGNKAYVDQKKVGFWAMLMAISAVLEESTPLVVIIKNIFIDLSIRLAVSLHKTVDRQ
jgi:hypothetical protein